MKQLLAQLADGRSLSVSQAGQAFEQIMTGQASPIQTAALLALIHAKSPDVDEIVAAVRVMRAKMVRVDVPDGLTVIDTCGMGGTHSRFFNISTSAAIVAAAVSRPRGVAVAKHGNRSITSKTGSSEVLGCLGVNVQVSGPTLTRCLDEAGICFCFAPQHHPAMKHVMPVRVELGFRTIFNLLGPLTNPAGARRQLIGVPSLAIADVIAEALASLDAEHIMLVHSTLPDGSPLGELTTFGPTQVREFRNGMIQSHQIDPSTLDLSFGVPDAITVDSPEQSAQIVNKVFAGEHGPARDTVLINAAAALHVAGIADSLGVGLDLAREAIDQGQAQATLNRLAEITQTDQAGDG